MREPRPVAFETDEDILRVVHGVIDDGAPRRLPRNGAVVAVLLSPDDFATLEARNNHDPWQGYRPERARRALARSAGALTGVDVDKLRDDYRAARGQDSAGRPA